MHATKRLSNTTLAKSISRVCVSILHAFLPTKFSNKFALNECAIDDFGTWYISVEAVSAGGGIAASAHIYSQAKPVKDMSSIDVLTVPPDPGIHITYTLASELQTTRSGQMPS